MDNHALLLLHLLSLSLSTWVAHHSAPSSVLIYYLRLLASYGVKSLLFSLIRNNLTLPLYLHQDKLPSLISRTWSSSQGPERSCSLHFKYVLNTCTSIPQGTVLYVIDCWCQLYERDETYFRSNRSSCWEIVYQLKLKLKLHLLHTGAHHYLEWSNLLYDKN